MFKTGEKNKDWGGEGGGARRWSGSSRHHGAIMRGESVNQRTMENVWSFRHFEDAWMAGSAHASMGTGILTLGSSSHSWGGYIRDYADLSLSNHYEKYNVWICMILRNVGVENNPITIRVYRRCFFFYEYKSTKYLIERIKIKISSSIPGSNM